ncbi:MAG: hypothetical protein KKG04_04190 [Candidatus Thermoplasmatota archaeon]|nr:hypothetical protein [Candidatus Thermoplasmatota archaeon]
MSKTKANNIRRKIKQRRKLNFELLMLPYFIIILAVIIIGVKIVVYNIEFKQVLPETTYQTVFLSNGQVYIGHLQVLSRSYWKLTDVYYIQQQQTIASDTVNPDTNSAQFSLMPLGSELHEPQSEVILNKDHVLYWQNLKDDSRIIDAINSQK